MTEAGIGRVLSASLHQAITDLLPDRLEFYENWLNPEGLRKGRIGVAPLHAVLSFLRQEDHVYPSVVERAGRYAADWTMASRGKARRLLLRLSPRRARERAALTLVRRTVAATFAGTRALVRFRKGRGTIEVRNSLFCTVREPVSEPLCGFYSALVARLLELHDARGQVSTTACRGVGDRSCLLHIEVGR